MSTTEVNEINNSECSSDLCLNNATFVGKMVYMNIPLKQHQLLGDGHVLCNTLESCASMDNCQI